jgi:hypothetical protein
MTLGIRTDTIRRLGEAWIDTHVYSIQEDLEYIRDFFGLDKTGPDMKAITGVAAASLSDLYKPGNDRQTRRAEHIALVATLLRDFSALMRAETGQAEPVSRDAMRRWLHTGEIGTDLGTRTPVEVLRDTGMTIAALNDVRASAIGE